MTITRDEALAILARDLARCEPRVSDALPGAAQPAFDGGVSFDFNTGAIDRASWVSAWRAGDFARARAGLMMWTMAGGRDVAGLVRRRQAEARLIFDGDYGAGTAAPDASDETLRRDLASLGFSTSPDQPVGGAVVAYQKSHPDLVADGIAGAATRASIARDIAARRAAAGTAGAVATAVAGSGAVAAHAGSGKDLVVAGALAVFAVLLVALAAMRHGDELKRILTRTREALMMKQMKAWWDRLWSAVKGWKTMIVSSVLAVVGVLQTADWATIVSPTDVGPTILGIAIVVAVLRSVTDTPVGRRGDTPPPGGRAT
jgi:lysozyme